MTKKPPITVERVRELFNYDPDRGVLTRRITVSENARENDSPGFIKKGYLVIRVSGKDYFAHRLIWLHQHGKFPEGPLDHINRVKTDNRLSNLREVTPSQNMQNTNEACHNTSGTKGVVWVKETQKWRVKIRLENQRFHLGNFDSYDEAVSVYQGARSLLHTHRPTDPCNIVV